MNIQLKSISELLGMKFFIPSYQRGYRWTEQQVKDLLEDVWEFVNKKDKKDGEFYCLQPIVVKLCSEQTKKDNGLEGGDWYEVIDGQQRLTTIFLLIHYFNEMWVGKKKITEFDLKYETRNSNDFLANIRIEGCDVVSTAPNDECIDYFYMSQAYKTIDNWVDAMGEFDNNSFQSIFKQNTQVIWYELPQEADSIQTFTRINIGKIPLTNAELIKALFLQKRNFTDNEANLRQIEIAKEWDAMEYELQKESLWAFLNKGENTIPARIEILFDMMYKVAKTKDADTKYGKDQYSTFRYFNEKFKDDSKEKETVKDVWDNVKKYFEAFKDWYNNNEWYHYIGYLIWVGSSVEDIYKLYDGCTKSQFVERLRKEVKQTLGKIEYEGENSVYKVNLSYDDKEKVRRLLLLYNIEFILLTGKSNYRFPFDLFKQEKWDIEHISSQTENTLKKEEDKKAWIENAYKVLDEDEKEKYDEFMSQSEDVTFESQRDMLISLVGEDKIDDELKNSVGNLALLNSGINRGYGNAIFPVKRNSIMENDKNGAFIPLCTKNAFMKYLTGGNNMRWGSDDIQGMTNDIVKTLNKHNYLTKK